MKLLHVIQKGYLLYSAISLVLGGVLFYFTLKYFLNSEFSEQLHQEKISFIDYYSQHTGHDLSNSDRDIIVEKCGSSFSGYEKDTVIINTTEHNEAEINRMLVFPFQQNALWYHVTILKPLYETEDLALTISGVVLAILLLQFLLMQFLNRRFTKKLFYPFLETVVGMQQYQLDAHKEVNLPISSIEEFQNLNQAFLRLHERAHSVYDQLQQFVGNASHELQTPLAVLQSKIELLAQGDSLTEEQIILLQDIRSTVHRLAKLNQSLLLMAKIDNRFFLKNETVSITTVVAKLIDEMHDLIQFKGIALKYESKNELSVEMNSVLADALISNMLINALRHTNENGFIHISIAESQLIISNSGEQPLDEEKIFQRFYKSSNANESSGLGLAIVKQICDQYSFNISYKWDSGTHIFSVDF